MKASFEEKRKVIRQLEKTKSFSGKDFFIKILFYLVDAEEQQRDIKSTTIAIDLLGNDDTNISHNVRDTQMRGKIRELRKLLDLHYLTEGKKENYRLSVAKSSYLVKLQRQERQGKSLYSLVMRKPLLTFKVLTALLLLSITCFVFSLVSRSSTNKTTNNVSTKTSFVSHFFDYEHSLDVIVGDRAFYSEYDQKLKRHRYIYDSDVELPHVHYKMFGLTSKYPEKKIMHGYDFTHSDIDNLLFAAEIKSEWNTNYAESQIKRSSVMDGMMPVSNTVFISKFESGELYGLSAYFSNSNFKFKSNTGDLVGEITHLVQEQDSTKLRASLIKKEGKTIRQSFLLLKKITTGSGKSLLFILASSDTERKFVIRNLYDDKFKAFLFDSFDKHIPNEFELLIRFEGSNLVFSSYEIAYKNMIQ